MASSTSSFDIIIIGGGISGIHTAYRMLLFDDLIPPPSILILEARSRLGGRLASVPIDTPDSNERLDLGATWFWPNEHRVRALVAELDLPTHAAATGGAAVYQDHGGNVHVLDHNPLDTPASRFTHGGDSMVHAMADRIREMGAEIKLETPVVRVTGQGEVTTHDGTVYSARAVVMALPPALALHAITFEPELEYSVSSVASQIPIWMATTAKVVVLYDSAFWGPSSPARLSGSAASKTGPVYEWHDMSSPSQPALMGFAGSDPPPTHEEVGSQLEALFGSDAASPSRIIVQNWKNEPYTATPDVDDLGSYRLFGHPAVQGNISPGSAFLAFTSTETSSTAPGHIEGALSSSIKLASLLHDHLLTTKPQPQSS